ncbi:EboA domain-containing protein [Saccharothrix yanglingensis]|uniref:Sugar phosphate isomerase n=1 Tax=Saccharothrix yanglingensis TaxID=659496 RepID=A0ABU0X6G5_9PSEU|nr:EboA domain-containing protein [Saccharothrix yanglingensis]MDQ2587722.1 sugar phosphate isomerase [Saccharothrix yanglingensis]
MTFRLGYGTNGFAGHRLDDALAVIADLGYRGVALTLDHHHLDPYADDLPARVDAVARRLAELDLTVVVETGARYLLDAHRKHHPTLVSEGQDRRVDFLGRAILVARDLGADCVSFWSGVAARPDGAWDRLRSGVARVVDLADRAGVRLGLEPEPGHVVERLDQALALRAELGDPAPLGITLDVGHCVAVEPEDAAACVRRAGDLLVNVQLDDMLPGVHEHLEFGEGDLDLRGTLAALDDTGYRGLAAVELPRHSHAAPRVARRAFAALTAATAPDVPDPDWLAEAERRVRADPAAIRALFPAVGREVGRGPLRADDPGGLVHGTVDDAARARLVAALPDATELPALYRYGDDAERRGVLRALTPDTDPDVGLPIVRDALRANDTRLVAAALGPFAARHLDRHAWRHGVLKCLFTGIPLAAVHGLRDRTDDELLRMTADYAAEREAAGRDVPADALRLLGRTP